ncbi:ferritin family protein [Scatolibacter rhodanostii]|uniref:ferritin family protein n=1 Tax=Scatolibacter rhodanostii TaxID=2014781 RepID=UPI000C084F47|nr:ferritin family protein [Scatolibacter rhodanostii]
MNDYSNLWTKLKIDLPYPSVTLTKSDCQYVAMLSDAYAGKGSESTSSNQYLVHRFYLQAFPEIEEAYQILASTERTHQKLLGNLIFELGSPPNLFSQTTNCYWSGGFVHKRNRLIPIFESDAQEERAAIAHYKVMIQTVTNKSMQDLFKRIIMDEELHLAYLESLIAEFKKASPST